MNNIRKKLNILRGVVPGRVEVPLDSSAIRSASYERHMRRMEVVFNKGTVYEYGSVEPALFRALVNSPSAGRFFQQEIRDRYPYRRIS